METEIIKGVVIPLGAALHIYLNQRHKKIMSLSKRKKKIKKKTLYFAIIRKINCLICVMLYSRNQKITLPYRF